MVTPFYSDLAALSQPARLRCNKWLAKSEGKSTVLLL